MHKNTLKKKIHTKKNYNEGKKKKKLAKYRQKQIHIKQMFNQLFFKINKINKILASKLHFIIYPMIMLSNF